MATIANGNLNQNQSGGKKHSKTKNSIKTNIMQNFKFSVVVVIARGVNAVRILDVTITRVERTYRDPLPLLACQASPTTCQASP